MRRLVLALALVGLMVGTGDPVAGQTPEPLEVGVEAPDFTLPAAVRHGILAEPVSLSDYEGQTVVLSFFFRARTKG